MQKLVMGVDMGGTNITAGQVTRKGRIIRAEKRETLAKKGKDAVIKRIKELVYLLMNDKVIGGEKEMKKLRLSDSPGNGLYMGRSGSAAAADYTSASLF